jgi:glucosamine-6-phosphate isomerase
MLTQIFQDYESLSLHTAKQILSEVTNNRSAVLCLAAGDTPRLAYTQLASLAREARIDFSACTFIGLDEWVGIPPENEGSCHYFLRHHLFDPLVVKPSQIHLFDAMAEDVALECTKMDRIIKDKGGIDLMLVGVGMNGHIGFNEPGVAHKLYSHVIPLDATTQAVGQKYFKTPTTIRSGITLGLRHFLESRKAILMASGTKKSEVIRRALEEPVTIDMPAGVVREHSNSAVMLDKDAAILLKKQ